MLSSNKDSYNYGVGQRLKRIMEICDLTVSGLNAFSGISDSHLYSIINGNRNLTIELAEQIGVLLNFDGHIIFNLNATLPNSIGKNNNLNKFKKENKANFRYFISEVDTRKRSSIALKIIKRSNILEQPQYLSDIRNIVNSSVKIKFDSDELSKILNYLVKKKKLKKIKKRKILKSGDEGVRLFDVFSIYK